MGGMFLDDQGDARSALLSHDVVTFQIFALRDDRQEILEEESELEAIRCACIGAVLPECQGYIWQHERFDLQITKLNSPAPRHLEGSVRYGDNVEDEWLVVSILLKLTKQFPRIVASVRDGDGEFLLIEAASALPKWVTPITAKNRVFLSRGDVHLLPRDVAVGAAANGAGKLPPPEVAEAVKAVADANIPTRAPAALLEQLQPRLRDMPNRMLVSGLHQARCRVPRSVAYILQHEPQLVAPAVNTFYNRLPADLKAAARMTNFPPHDFTTVLVNFNRCLYAQLTQQHFEPPRQFPMPLPSHPDYKAAYRGMKATANNSVSGFLDSHQEPAPEDTAWAAFKASLVSNGYFAGEMEGSKLHRELLQKAIESYRTTAAYTSSTASLAAPALRCQEILMGVDLQAHTFLEAGPDQGEDDSWLEKGETLLESELQQRQAELAQLQAEEDEDGFEDESDSGSEAEEPEDHKEPRATSMQSGDKRPALHDSDHDATAQQATKLQEVVQGVHNLLNSKSSYKGVEATGERAFSLRTSSQMLDDDSDEDEGDFDFDGDLFMSELQQVLGLRGDDDRDRRVLNLVEVPDFPKGFLSSFSAGSNNGLNKAQASSSGESQNFLRKVEAPDYTHEEDSDDESDEESFMKAYDQTLSKELQGTTMGASFRPGVSSVVETPASDTGQATATLQAHQATNMPNLHSYIDLDHDSVGKVSPVKNGDDNEGVDLDLNLVQSLLASYSAQGGLPGPISNLVGMMGLELPDDAEELGTEG